MRKIIISVLKDTYIILYKFYRFMRKTDPPGKAIAYAEELSGLFLALIACNIVLVPIGVLMAFIGLRFTITRYILVGCMLVVLVLSKKKAVALLAENNTDDQVLIEQYSSIHIGRWVALLLYWLALMIGPIALGYFYGDIARLGLVWLVR